MAEVFLNGKKFDEDTNYNAEFVNLRSCTFLVSFAILFAGLAGPREPPKRAATAQSIYATITGLPFAGMQHLQQIDTLSKAFFSLQLTCRK